MRRHLSKSLARSRVKRAQAAQLHEYHNSYAWGQEEGCDIPLEGDWTLSTAVAELCLLECTRGKEDTIISHGNCSNQFPHSPSLPRKRSWPRHSCHQREGSQGLYAPPASQPFVALHQVWLHLLQNRQEHWRNRNIWTVSQTLSFLISTGRVWDHSVMDTFAESLETKL